MSTMRDIIYTILFIALFLVVMWLASHAHAHDWERMHVSQGMEEWIGTLRSERSERMTGAACCSTADGQGMNDDIVWDTADGHYRVEIEGHMWPVPDDAVIPRPNRLGRVMVWWTRRWGLDGVMTPDIRCFLPGTGG